MPLYEYVCRDCGHRFEVLQRMGDSADGLVCPECGALGPERQWSTFSGAVSGRSATSGGLGSGPGCAGGGGFT